MSSEESPSAENRTVLFDDEGAMLRSDDCSGVNLEEKCVNSTSEKDQTCTPSEDSSDVCAICLEEVQRESFLDRCLHSFCFECITKWSKIKKACPRCNQTFTSIVHNVRSDADYDQYSASSNNEDNPERVSAMISGNPSNRNPLLSLLGFAYLRTSHYVWTTVHNVDLNSLSGLSCRNRVYETAQRVLPLQHRMYRISSPEYYRQNPARCDRLAPWLNRNLQVLLSDGDDESLVPHVLELVLRLIRSYEICSYAFYRNMKPYLNQRTSHFIHQFHNYANSMRQSMSRYDNSTVDESFVPLPDSSTDFSLPNSQAVLVTKQFPSSSTTDASQNSATLNFHCSTSTSDISRKATESSQRHLKWDHRNNSFSERHGGYSSRNNVEVASSAHSCKSQNLIDLGVVSSSVAQNSDSKSGMKKRHPKRYYKSKEQGNVILPSHASGSGHCTRYNLSDSKKVLDVNVASSSSTSRFHIANGQSKIRNPPVSHIYYESSASSDDDDDCVFMGFVNPSQLCPPPEIIDLESSSDEDERRFRCSSYQNVNIQSKKVRHFSMRARRSKMRVTAKPESSESSESGHCPSSSSRKCREVPDMAIASAQSSSPFRDASDPSETENATGSPLSEESSVSSNSDDCVFLDVVNPRELRAPPEIIYLTSSSVDNNAADNTSDSQNCRGSF